jgi:hypothetical protein
MAWARRSISLDIVLMRMTRSSRAMTSGEIVLTGVVILMRMRLSRVMTFWQRHHVSTFEPVRRGPWYQTRDQRDSGQRINALPDARAAKTLDAVLLGLLRATGTKAVQRSVAQPSHVSVIESGRVLMRSLFNR